MAQGCQIFLGTKYQNGKIYQITTNYTKCPIYVNITKDRKMDKVTIKYVHHHLPLQDPPTFSQIWIFGLKTKAPEEDPGVEICRSALCCNWWVCLQRFSLSLKCFCK
jgi:hypothetical protein